MAIRVVLWTLSMLLALGGAAKLRRPDPLRRLLGAAALPAPGLVAGALGSFELLAAACGLGLPARIGAWPVAATFGGLAAGAAIVLRRAPGTPCGCFGEGAGPALSRRHAALTLAAAAIAVAAGLVGGRAMVSEPAGALAPAAAASLALALTLRELARRDAAQLDAMALRLVDSSSRVLGAPVSRRSLLARLALGGSALAVAPLRYLLYPGSAMAVIVPSSCAGGLCSDGYTAFCCEITGGLNRCPSGTFAGDWWMCTDYTGHQLCDGAGVRYYVDCNNLPGRPFPGGCRCANDSCERRRVACNVFRYGQCNGHIPGTTAVVCRMVTCVNPATIPALHCSGQVMATTPCAGTRLRAWSRPRCSSRAREELEAMIVLVIVDTILLALALVYIVALLRSHADILRRLTLLEEGAGAGAVQAPAEPAGAGACASPERLRGRTLDGDPAELELGPGSPPTLLAFLTGGCSACRPIWHSLADPAQAGALGARVVAVTHDPARESVSQLRRLAAPTVPVLTSSAAWSEFAVPSSPHFVLTDGHGGIAGRGSALAWEQLVEMVARARADADEAARRARSTGERAARTEMALARSGIGPGHPSLYAQEEER